MVAAQRGSGRRLLGFLGLLLFLFVVYQIEGEVGQDGPSMFSDWKQQSRRKFAIKSTDNQPDILSWKDLVELRQDNEELIKYIRKQLRSPTPSRDQLQNYKWTDVFTVLDATQLMEKRDGFFIEVEAKDGIQSSQSIHWESDHNWTGLLIEADEANYNKLLTAGRRAFMLKGCLCRTEWTEKMYYHSGSYYGVPNTEMPGGVEMLCYPFYSVMRAMNVTTIDLMVVNVAGWELDILQTIPLDELNVLVFVVEYRSMEAFQHLQSYMESHDYKTFCRLKRSGIFTKKQILWSKTANETGYPQDQCLYIYKFSVH